MKKILYISIDGLLDPLGRSQILPYIDGSSKENLFFFICTIENSRNMSKINELNQIIKKNKNIKWNYFFFKKKRGKINRLIELFMLYYLAIKIFIFNKIDIIHSRSYLPMFLCILIKLFSKVKLIFDTRGAWFDERIDGGMLKSQGFDLVVFKIMKIFEKYFFKFSDHIIFLTKKGFEETKRNFIKNKNISIIACAADYNLFKIISKEEKIKIKQNLKLSNKFIITYSGSFGSWYNFNYIIDFFINYLKKNINSRLIILTQSDIPREYYKLSMDIKKKIILISSRRDFIPIIVGISDLTLCFIKPTFSKKFSSPTKVGESLGCGIPVVLNEGIGDLDDDIIKMGLGFKLNNNRFIDDDDLKKIDNLEETKLRIRKNSNEKYNLESAVNKFIQIYKFI